MRKVIYSMASSLDGYIAGPGGEFDWIPDEPGIDWAAFMQRFDTVLMGRHTYEVLLKDPSGSALPDKPTYVFSRSLDQGAHPKVTVVSDDGTDLVEEIRNAPGRDIWLMGGGVLFRSLLRARLVDSVEIGLVPVLLGEGIPLLPNMDRKTVLNLRSTKAYPGGIILMNYDVVPDAT